MKEDSRPVVARCQGSGRQRDHSNIMIVGRRSIRGRVNTQACIHIWIRPACCRALILSNWNFGSRHNSCRCPTADLHSTRHSGATEPI